MTIFRIGQRVFLCDYRLGFELPPNIHITINYSLKDNFVNIGSWIHSNWYIRVIKVT